MDYEDLKNRIKQFVDTSWKDHRPEFIRQELFSFILTCLNERTLPKNIPTADIDMIRDAAVINSQKASLPMYLDRQEATQEQRITWCYVDAFIRWLRSNDLIQYMLVIDTQPPINYTPTDDQYD